ncbi:hypothetical protein ACH4YO_36160 [Streptomyces noursei]|uniref:hypothetical protein n=1 Tax=Streptomyces noursei TaxID=1971 RepID=UPI0033ECDC1C
MQVAKLTGNQVDECATKELHAFANGLCKDLDTVTAGLTLPLGSGIIEGNVTRVKLLKRQHYGRAGFDVPRRAPSRPADSTFTESAEEPNPDSGGIVPGLLMRWRRTTRGSELGSKAEDRPHTGRTQATRTTERDAVAAVTAREDRPDRASKHYRRRHPQGARQERAPFAWPHAPAKSMLNCTESAL